jgi:hypothetical protein
MAVGPPAIPDSEKLVAALQIETWGAGEQIVRVYHRDYGPSNFNPTASSRARFRPIYTADGGVVSTAYGGADVETALAETLLRGVDALAAGTRRRLYLTDVVGVELATMLPERDLALARLRGQGLTRLGLRRAEVIDCEESRYPYTAKWAQAIHDCPVDLAGIVWTSRQNDANRALVLWQGPTDPAELELTGEPLALDSEPGLELVRTASELAGFDFEV